MTANRAKKGGQIGQNGEFYRGGTFLPTTKLPKQSPQTNGRGTRRTQIAPNEWAAMPSTVHISLFATLAGVYARLEHDGTLTLVDTASCTAGWYDEDLREIEKRIAAYNAGYRWLINGIFE